jgi:hypothetical protein
MSKIVKYCIYGVVERYISIKAGKTTLNIAFSGGVMDSSGIKPAVYVTSNALEQYMIENHPDFKNGKIKVLKEQVIENAPIEETPEAKVRTLQQARQFLIEKGVPMEVLQNKAAILEYAEKKGIVFPNYK